jgi:hypothetical protein
MTTLLQKAFAQAEKLPADEHDVIAARLLAELSPEDEFDRPIASTAHKLAGLAAQALNDHGAELTEPLNADQI